MAVRTEVFSKSPVASHRRSPLHHQLGLVCVQCNSTTVEHIGGQWGACYYYVLLLLFILFFFTLETPKTTILPASYFNISRAQSCFFRLKHVCWILCTEAHFLVWAQLLRAQLVPHFLRTVPVQACMSRTQDHLFLSGPKHRTLVFTLNQINWTLGSNVFGPVPRPLVWKCLPYFHFLVSKRARI